MGRSIDFVSFVVPTYNERENLPKLVEAVARHVKRDYEVVVVDDASPDGTADVAQQLMQDHPIVLHARPGKGGLGSAYREGFAMARGDVIFEMDADFSHDPRYVPALLEALSEGAGLAIGSRYVHGGRVNGWGAYRKIVSGVGNMLARTALPLRVRDTTSGYRAWSAQAKDAVLQTRSDGYAFQVESLFLARRLGIPIAEVPIVFENRSVGASKLRIQEFGAFLQCLGRLRFAGASPLPRPSATGGSSPHAQRA